MPGIKNGWKIGLLAVSLCIPACTHAQVPPPAPDQPPVAQPAPSVPRAAAAGEAARARAAEVRAKAFSAARAGNQSSVWVSRSGGKKEKATFLGVVAVQADPALRDQLKLPRGIGLVVQSVENNTPAAKAGVQEHDLITKLDDQWLVNAQQFGVLIRMHKPDDEITLTGLRRGDPITIKAKLGEKEMVISDSGEETQNDWGVNGFTLNGEALKGLGSLVIQDDAPLVIGDNDRTLKVTVDNGERHLVATDKDDNVLFDGPVETDEQRKALPPDIAQQLDKYKEQFDKVKDGSKQRIIINNNDR